MKESTKGFHDIHLGREMNKVFQVNNVGGFAYFERKREKIVVSSRPEFEQDIIKLVKIAHPDFKHKETRDGKDANPTLAGTIFIEFR